MRINNNLMAMNTHRQLGINSGSGAKSIEKLSSGLRINRAGDDAAGLAISEKMRGQIRGLDQASRNSQDAISLVQTAEGALNETQAILQRMRELAVQSANDTNEGEDRTSIQTEMDQLTSEINRISETTEFNKKKLLDGSLGIVETEGRSVDTSAGNEAAYNDTIADSLSAVAVSSADMDAGAYTITVTKESVNEISTSQISSIADAEVLTTNPTDVAEGNYKIAVTADTVKNVASGTLASGTGDLALLGTGDESSITLSASSNLGSVPGTDYAIDIVKTTVKTATGTSAAGISNLDVSAFDDATRFDVEVNAVIDKTAIADVGAGGALYKNDDTTGAISNIQLTTDSGYSEADSYKIKIDQLGDTQSLKTADLTGQTAVDLSDDLLNIDVGGGAQAVTLTNVQALGGAGYDAVANIANVQTALQADIDAVFDGTANGGTTFTVNVSGNQLEITSNQDIIGSDFDLTGVNDLLLAGSSSAVTNTTDDVKLRMSLTSDVPAANTVIESAEATFTNTAGAQSIALGNISFDVDNAKVYASETVSTTDAIAGAFNNLTIDLSADAIKTEVKVTMDNSVDPAFIDSTLYKQDGSDDGLAESFTLDGKALTMDIDATLATTGQTQVTTVDENTSYTVQLGTDSGGGTVAGGDELGVAYTFTETDLADPANVTNIDLGAAGNGISIDLDTTALRALTGTVVGAKSSIDFTIAEVAGFKAEIVNADGTDAGYDEVALSSSAGVDQTVSLGGADNLTMEYDADGTLAAGDVFFSVKTETENFTATLKNDAEAVDTEVVTGFNAGDQINFANTGVTLETSTDLSNADNATFNVIETGESVDNSVKMQIGANTGQNIAIDINNMGSNAIGVSSETLSDTKVVTVDGNDFTANYKATSTVEAEGDPQFSLDISSHDNATAAIEVINLALTTISDERGKLGSVQNRLEHTIKNLDTSSENLQASESRIRDVDMAKEMMEFTKNNILSQAAQTMLAQANKAPEGVLQLLR